MRTTLLGRFQKSRRGEYTRGMLLAFSVLLFLGSIGCATSTNSQKGALIGGTAGKDSQATNGSRGMNTAESAILGATVGGGAGEIIGTYMDDHADRLIQVLELAEVERLGEGIKITFDAAILFPSDETDLSPEARIHLKQLARTLTKFPDTTLIIEGHTDSSGSDTYNQTLSVRRSQSVKAFLASDGVAADRMSTVGYGELQPIADNDSEEGRASNRRVEVAIMASEELQQDAVRQSTSKN